MANTAKSKQKKKIISTGRVVSADPVLILLLLMTGTQIYNKIKFLSNL